MFWCEDSIVPRVTDNLNLISTSEGLYNILLVQRMKENFIPNNTLSVREKINVLFAYNWLF